MAPLLSVAVCLRQNRALSRRYLRAARPTLVRARGRGRKAGEIVGVSGALTGWSAPLGRVNQPPDANRVGMCGHLSTGTDSTPEGTA